REALERALDLEGAPHPQARAGVGLQPVDAAAVERHLAARLDVAGEGVEERRLAGAVGADEAQDGALVERERHAVDGHQAAEAYRDALSLERSWHSAS